MSPQSSKRVGPDNDLNQELYGSKVTNKEILMGGPTAPAGVMGLITAALNRYSPRHDADPSNTKK
jgi:lipid-binding SYLF domain-containing protein